MGAKRGRDPLLIEVLCELGAGRISEDFIRSKGFVVDGLCDGRHVVVNPIHAVVDTVIHELLHRARPDWSERTVRSRTKKLVWVLTDAEKQTVYDMYQRIATKVKRRGRREWP